MQPAEKNRKASLWKQSVAVASEQAQGHPRPPLARGWKAIWFEIVLFGCCAALLLSAAIGHG